MNHAKQIMEAANQAALQAVYSSIMEQQMLQAAYQSAAIRQKQAWEAQQREASARAEAIRERERVAAERAESETAFCLVLQQHTQVQLCGWWHYINQRFECSNELAIALGNRRVASTYLRMGQDGVGWDGVRGDVYLPTLDVELFTFNRSLSLAVLSSEFSLCNAVTCSMRICDVRASFASASASTASARTVSSLITFSDACIPASACCL